MTTPLTAQSVLDALFSDLHGYSLSAAGRSRLGLEGETALTYGELTPQAMQKIFDVVPTEGVFYDLGSGTGKPVIFAAYLGSFSKSVGIELVDELWEASAAVHRRYEEQVKPHLPLEKQMQTLEFRCGDIFREDFSDGDVVIGHCTCFNDELVKRFSQKCESLKSGAHVVTLTSPLQSDQFEFLGSTSCEVPWGAVTLWIHRRK